jgi:glutathione S-transferase
MYRLFWHPSSSSYAPMAVLEEIGVPFDLHQVDYDGGEHRSPAYLRRQPLGLIPALELDDGRSMFESGAIVLHLCDRHPETNLAPSPADVERPTYLQWLFFMADTIYPSYNRLYWPQRYTVSPDHASDVAEQARRTVMTQWQVVEDALGRGGPWLLGRRFSACDIYLQMMTTWHESPSELLAALPHVREVARGVVARDSCRRALRRHHFETGLGEEAAA